ncbi:hypothetical protein W97_06521 [Coniosporium apollinis CBS 100218]|uniref:2EXR domain-containing protein n=1 Tax=Coniosporium apollinis (strain CBS 100218) TaxID=1168221 RepID=R7YZK5_CONA1|nr:uncharacterized protein W97_06521 [Coniosporium apollinis CBS 100218]EON67268.1 hypothetical protein W97_06521 [Coniosporium apollinis CBS 100218]
MRTVPRKAKSTTAGMKRKRAAAPGAKDTLAAAIAVSAGAVSSVGGALSGKAAASGKDAPATESTPAARDVLGSDGTPSAGNVTDATTPTPKSNRPTRVATKRRYTIADYPGFDDEDFEHDLADSSDEVEDEEGAVRTSKKRKVSSPKKRNEPKPFPFLLLPAEIRNTIYAYTLTTENDIRIEAKTRASRRVAMLQAPNDRSKRASFLPALLATNRQVYQEAASVLYSQPLIFIDAYGLYSFLAQIGSARPLVKSITLENMIHGRSMHKHCNHSAFTLLIGCTSLKRIRLGRGAISWGRTTSRIARHFYREAHYWLEDVGRQKGRRDAAIDLIEFTEEAQGRLVAAADARWYYPGSSHDMDLEKARQAEEEFLADLTGML